MENWLDRITFGNKHLLRDLQEIGIIAGGCIATPKHCRDVDIFLSEWTQWYAIQAKLQQHKCVYHEQCLSSSYVPESDEIEKETAINVIEVQIMGESVPLQIVFSEARSPFELIKGFDMDYVQVAIHKGQLITTDEFLNATSSRVVSHLRLPLTTDRFEKALLKGFSVPWLATGRMCADNKWIEMPMEEPKLRRIPTTTAPHEISVALLTIFNLRHRKTWEKRGKETIQYFDFIVLHNHWEIAIRSLSIRGVIRDVISYEATWFWLEDIGHEKEFTFRIPRKDIVLQKGDDLLLIVEASSHGNGLRFDVQQLFFAKDSNIIPIPFHDSFIPNVRSQKLTHVQDRFKFKLTASANDVSISWVHNRIDQLEHSDDKMEWIACMAYKALVYYAPEDKCSKAAEQFASDVRKHLGSDKVEQDLGSDILSRFALGGKLREDVSSVSSVVRFIENELKKGQPSPGVNNVCLIS
jgi:hypothetical protein